MGCDMHTDNERNTTNLMINGYNFILNYKV